MTGYDEKATRELLLHIDNLFNWRAHFLLALQVVLFLAVLAFWEDVPRRLAIASVALVLTAILFITNVNLANKLHWLMDRWREIEPSGLVRDYSAERARIADVTMPRSVHLLTWPAPLLAMVGWIAILASVLV